jgi:hypothetical protein
MSKKEECRDCFHSWKQLHKERLDAKFLGESTKLSPPEEARKAKEAEEDARKLFQDSQWIESGGEPFNCTLCDSKANCNFVSAAQEKCACQSLFGGRPQVHYACDPSSILLLEGLSKERCERNGYLTDDYPKLASRMQISYDGVEVSQPSQRRFKDSPNLKDFASLPITCNPCRSQFEALRENWSWTNLKNVHECIENLPDEAGQRQGNLDAQPVNPDSSECSCTGTSSAPCPPVPSSPPVSQQSGDEPPQAARRRISSQETPSSRSSSSSTSHHARHGHGHGEHGNGGRIVSQVKDAIREGFATLDLGWRAPPKPFKPPKPYKVPKIAAFPDLDFHIPASDSGVSTLPLPQTKDPLNQDAPNKNLPADIYASLVQGGSGTDGGDAALKPALANPFTATWSSPPSSPNPPPGIPTSSNSKSQHVTYAIITLLVLVIAMVVVMVMGRTVTTDEEESSRPLPQTATFVTQRTSTPLGNEGDHLDIPIHTTRPNGTALNIEEESRLLSDTLLNSPTSKTTKRKNKKKYKEL